VTYYDDAVGERVELSGITLANWVAKTANLLQDEFDVGPGSTVALALPVHWQTAAVLLAAWRCGGAVLDVPAGGAELAGADVALTTQADLPTEADAAETPVLGLSLHPLGLGMAGYTGPARDFALEVRGQGDHFQPYQDAEPDDPALLLGELTLTHGVLATTALELVERLGIGAGDRLLVDADTAAEAGAVSWLLAPLLAGASLVLCRHPAPEGLAQRVAAERVTATLGLTVPGVRHVGRPAGQQPG
jgi:uncharacterized protein (TIGR03089 family)